jgi:predicted DNA-binding transcriptional regulator AlpA
MEQSAMQQANPSRTEIVGFALPATGYARLPVVVGVTGVAKSTIWTWCRQGRFPAPVKLSERCTAWPVAAIREWLADPAGWQASKSLEG